MGSFLVTVACSYLLGSIPFGYLLVRIVRGEDVRQSGSGNIGATNVARSSPVLGVLTLLLDALKGSSAVWLTYQLLQRAGNIDVDLYPFVSTAGVCAVVGHMFPVWLRFRGGKGVATSLGAFALLAPHATLGSLGVFLLVALVSRYVSLASIAASASFPLLAWVSFRGTSNDSLLRISPMAIVACLVIAKHHQNIRRLLAGTENRLGSRHA
jgi:glycerol-3-phosphate acyltransferase PlsY